MPEGSLSAGRSERVCGMEMYFEVHGEGEPLLLLHGFTGCGADWRLLYDFESPPARHRLVVPDLRGHGGSTNPGGEFTLRQSGRDVLALLDRLEIESCKAIGLSAGAKTLLHAATEQPARIEAMVLVSAAPYFPQQARAIMRQMTADSQPRAEWQVMRQRHRHGDAQIRALWRQGNAFADSYDDMSFTPPLLATITARTLLVHGDRDPLYPVRLALELYDAIPRSYLWVLPGAGHGPIFGDAGPAFVAAATAFLAGEWDGPPGGPARAGATS